MLPDLQRRMRLQSNSIARNPAVQVFDFERWKTHRSSSRYLRHVLGIFDSKIVSRAWLLLHLHVLPTACCNFVCCKFHHGLLPWLPQVQGLAKPLAYVMTLATGVALYHTLAEVSCHPLPPCFHAATYWLGCRVLTRLVPSAAGWLPD